MTKRVMEIIDRAHKESDEYSRFPIDCEKLVELAVKECIKIITNYEIPVGNSAAGEIACDMTYRALVDIRKQIRETLGVKP